MNVHNGIVLVSVSLVLTLSRTAIYFSFAKQMSKNTPPKFTEHPLTHVFAWLHSPMEENYKASRAVILAL